MLAFVLLCGCISGEPTVAGSVWRLTSGGLVAPDSARPPIVFRPTPPADGKERYRRQTKMPNRVMLQIEPSVATGEVVEMLVALFEGAEGGFRPVQVEVSDHGPLSLAWMEGNQVWKPAECWLPIVSVDEGSVYLVPAQAVIGPGPHRYVPGVGPRRLRLGEGCQGTAHQIRKALRERPEGVCSSTVVVASDATPWADAASWLEGLDHVSVTVDGSAPVDVWLRGEVASCGSSLAALPLVPRGEHPRPNRR